MVVKIKALLMDAYKDYKNVAIRLMLLMSIAVQSKIYVLLNNYRGKVYHIQSPIDLIIPFNKYFVIPYLFWYIYLGFIFFYYAVYDEKKYYKLLAGVNVGMMICFIIYYFFPTYVPRPNVYGEDIFSDLMRFIYKKDNPYNCFPSIHVLDSVLFAVYVNKDEFIELKYKLYSSAISFSIIISTMFVKQHYFYDAVSATILAYSIYVVFNYREFVEFFKRRVFAYIKE
ncbi:phosphatase PAP2 family protein [Thermobrachium celere]|uniref:Ser/Thr and Tyr protein phosphatase (Dual specificity) n=1 Tax=Thermobrachium celere DSM 8682 TaxID=941824 RepID=R7RUH8_9CLOT|nr:phosphatase PAP2 family protein [Thermobrachium celere]CDF59063.1 Ser/Thr and Tyr protein phosphatase (dual specificity) [Thermobrachium celere DSM 8682]